MTAQTTLYDVPLAPLSLREGDITVVEFTTHRSLRPRCAYHQAVRIARLPIDLDSADRYPPPEAPLRAYIAQYVAKSVLSYRRPLPFGPYFFGKHLVEMFDNDVLTYLLRSSCSPPLLRPAALRPYARRIVFRRRR